MGKFKYYVTTNGDGRWNVPGRRECALLFIKQDDLGDKRRLVFGLYPGGMAVGDTGLLTGPPDDKEPFSTILPGMPSLEIIEEDFKGVEASDC
jgi:hypothetical protein